MYLNTSNVINKHLWVLNMKILYYNLNTSNVINKPGIQEKYDERLLFKYIKCY